MQIPAVKPFALSLRSNSRRPEGNPRESEDLMPAIITVMPALECTGWSRGGIVVWRLMGPKGRGEL